MAIWVFLVLPSLLFVPFICFPYVFNPHSQKEWVGFLVEDRALACSEVMTINFYTSLSVQINPFFLRIWHVTRVFIVFNNLCFRLAPGDIQKHFGNSCFSVQFFSRIRARPLPVTARGSFSAFLRSLFAWQGTWTVSRGLFCFKSFCTVWQGNISPLLPLTLYLTSRVKFPPCPSLLAEQPTSTEVYFPRWCLSSLILSGFFLLNTRLVFSVSVEHSHEHCKQFALNSQLSTPEPVDLLNALWISLTDLRFHQSI